MDTLETSCKAVVAAEAVLVPRLLLKTELRRRADIFGRPQGQQIIQQEVCGGCFESISATKDRYRTAEQCCLLEQQCSLAQCSTSFSSASGIGALDCLPNQMPHACVLSTFIEGLSCSV